MIAIRTVNRSEDRVEPIASCEPRLNVSSRNGPAVTRLVTGAARPAVRAELLEKRPGQIDAATRICNEGFHIAAGIGEGEQVRKARLVLGEGRSKCHDEGNDAENCKGEGACKEAYSFIQFFSHPNLPFLKDGTKAIVIAMEGGQHPIHNFQSSPLFRGSMPPSFALGGPHRALTQ